MSASFVITAEQDVASPRGRLVEFIHPDNGARHLHLECDDDSAAFMLCFRTPAPDNSGLTHVLEHLLLSGSERFRQPNPFFALMKQSVANTMNASTGCDVMRLHFSTRNCRDFDNLLAFYLDSAFFPRLGHADFDREAGRVTRDGPADLPRFNGIIYNEMKGAMSRPEFHLHRRIFQELFPMCGPGFNEGGDWWRIPALSLQQVRDYHRHHFVAANAIFLTYGTVDARRCQERFLELALDRCEKGMEVPMPEAPHLEQERMERERMEAVPLPLALDTPRFFHARGIRMVGEDIQSAAVMARVLFEYLRKSGVAAGERRFAGASADALLADSGVYFRGREPVLVLALETTHPPVVGDDEDPFRRAAERLEAHPPGSDTLHSCMSRVRTRILDDQTRRDATGVCVLERIAYSAVYGDTPRYCPEGVVDQAFQKVCDRELLRDWIRHHLIENTGQVVLDAYTDRTGYQSILEEERRCIGAAVEHGAIRSAAPRRERNGARGDPLPTLSAADLDSLAGPDIDFEPVSTTTGVEVAHGEIGELCYLTLALAPHGTRPVSMEQLALDIEAIRQSLRRRADALGCDVDLQARVTGGCNVRLTAETTTPAGNAPAIASSLLQLLTRTLPPQADFDPQTVRADRARHVEARGHEMALKSALSARGANAAADHCINGLGLLPALDPSTDRAHRAAAGKTRLRWKFDRALVLCAEHRAADIVGRIGFPAGHEGPGRRITVAPETVGPTDLAWLFPGSVANCALAIAVEPLDIRHQAAAAVLCRILVDRVLEPLVRFEGGAYGVDCRYFPEYDAIGMCSYRDPGIERTLDSFNHALQELHAGDFDEIALERGRISEIARIEKLARTHVLRIRRAFGSRLDGDATTPARRARAVLEINGNDLRAAAAAVGNRDAVSRSVVCGPDQAAEIERLGFDTAATGPGLKPTGVAR